MSVKPSVVLSEYLSYPFESDEHFKKGLSDIVAANSQDVPDNLLRSMRVFYFNRTTGNSLSIEEVQAYGDSLLVNSTDSKDISNNTSATLSASNSHEPVLSLAQVQALIEAGKLDEIPNNKTIAGDLNAAPPTESTVPSRRKPWEASESSTAQGTMSGVPPTKGTSAISGFPEEKLGSYDVDRTLPELISRSKYRRNSSVDDAIGLFIGSFAVAKLKECDE
ncbi:hypothetical protein BDP27DRAFT_1417282 [Rhodocollybia butyracea]|uniref:Uncharacterized protein n=1 Tax=Rhodocollybia butyracea TaxID=206335 RepID=A0A9P5Q3H0_9AGAR|nr:hypothetical protein BDP27DRAFT_1417282 [Rhodocollybia butyracea]